MVRKYIIIIFFIDVIAKKIEVPIDSLKSFYLNIYEIKIDEDFIEDKQTIESFLFGCQCTLFLFDITSKKSFELIQKVIDIINFSKYPYMKCILLENKVDLEKNAQVNESQIADLMNEKKSFERLKISTKDKTGIDELIIKINKAVNESKNELAMNIISESVIKKQKLVNSQGYLSFILIGDTEVGKTCFFNRYFKDAFSFDFLSTIGIEKESKLVKINKEIYKITLWDTAGQERFKSLPRKYYQNADGVFLLFDITKEDTFNNVSNWMNDLKENSNITVGEDGKPKIPLFLLGNKIDSMERVISREQGEKLAISLGMKYFEISCKINMNIPEVMSQMIMESYMKTNHIDNCFKLEKKKVIVKKPEKKGFC
jgi:small GTP-binding protein